MVVGRLVEIGGALDQADARRRGPARRAVHGRGIQGGLPRVRRRRAAPSRARAATSRRPASTGTTRNTRATRTARTPGPCYVAEVSVDHGDVRRRASTTSSRCRKSARSSIRCSPPARSKAASRRRSATRSTSTSSGSDGRMANAQMTNYIMPTSMDLPPIRVFFEERPYAHGPFGAKGIGELPMDGVAPAIANAHRARHGRQGRSDSDHAGGLDERVRGGGGPWLTRRWSTCASRSTATSRS